MGKILIHTPAAYTSAAHETPFNGQFTSILRTQDSWKNSLSFGWVRDLDNPILFISHSMDEIIPKEISKKYTDLISSKKNSKIVEIKDAKHAIWNNENINREFKTKIIQEIINFL